MGRVVKERIRLTIPVSPEVHAAFSQMSDASGLPLGRCMGEWLEDTLEGAQLIALKLQEAKRAPVTVMREMQAMLHGFQGEVDESMERVRLLRKAGGGGSAGAAGATNAPRSKAPSSNTGLKSPPRTVRKP